MRRYLNIIIENKSLGENIDYMNDRYLYRGINQEMFRSSKGLLHPKLMNCPFTYVFRADGSIKADGSATAGPSRHNAVFGHKLNSDKFFTSEISSPPIFERAQLIKAGMRLACYRSIGVEVLLTENRKDAAGDEKGQGGFL